MSADQFESWMLATQSPTNHRWAACVLCAAGARKVSDARFSRNR